MTYVAMACKVMARKVMAQGCHLNAAGSHGLWGYGLNSYGLRVSPQRLQGLNLLRYWKGLSSVGLSSVGRALTFCATGRASTSSPSRPRRRLIRPTIPNPEIWTPENFNISVHAHGERRGPVPI